MKKSLVALAVLAASGASFAQSVTLYGIVDVWGGFTNSKNQIDPVTLLPSKSLTQTVLQSGGVNTSRWGMKGSEDLGGGLKADFKLEQGFRMDTGSAGTATAAPGTQAFDRQSWVGLSGGFGAVQIGKTWTAFDDVFGASDAMFDSGALAPVYAVFQSANYSDRPVNGLRYESPSVAGFAGVVTYALGEDKIPGKSANDTYAFNVTYGAGPVAVQLGYQVEENNAAGNADIKYALLGGSYDFGVAVGKVIFAHASNVGNVPGADAREYQIGVDVPVSDAVLLSASYAKSDDSLPAGAYEPTRRGYGVGATYTLSKRTFLYSGYTYSKATQFAAPDAKASAFALGIQHRF